MYWLHRSMYPRASGNTGDDFRTIPIFFCPMGSFFMSDDFFYLVVQSRWFTSWVTSMVYPKVPIKWNCHDKILGFLSQLFFTLSFFLSREEEEEERRVTRLQAKDKDEYYDTKSGGYLSVREGGDGWDGFVGLVWFLR